MDPPFRGGVWTYKSFGKFIRELHPHLSRCFIVVWVDPEDLEGVIEVFKQDRWVFCDSMSMEMLDPLNRAYTVKTDPSGFPRNSRMAVMWRTADIYRSDLRQQRIKDTGYGVVAESGKTGGRLSMPPTLHSIIEVMLPDRKTGPRVFVELWPNVFNRRPRWIHIDEIPQKNEPEQGENDAA
jgi:hypothetical protein